MHTPYLKNIGLIIAFLSNAFNTFSQEIELDQTSYTTGTKQVTTKMTKLDENVMARFGAVKEKESKEVTFILDIKLFNNGVYKNVEKGDFIYIVFKGGVKYWSYNIGNQEKSNLMMGVSFTILTEHWFELGFDNGSGAEITEIRVEDKTGLKIYSYPISLAGSKKFYACTKLLTDKIYER